MIDPTQKFSSFSPMRLLIVEDNSELLENLEAGLKEEGYFVDTARDGVEARYKMENWVYDAILLDVMLPKSDGFTLLANLRSRKDETPVLMLTAMGGSSNRIKGLNLGADDYLEKPFDFEELLARLRALIRRSTGNAGSTIEFGAIHIDLVNRLVIRNEQTIELTRQEFALLITLIQRRGRVVTREFLLERIYDQEENVNSNLLDVLIYNVRNKIGKELIQTRRGHGYIIPE